MKVAVLGAGSWGTALTTVLLNNGHEAVLWARRPDLVEEINTARVNTKYLPGSVLPSTIRATAEIADALQGADVVIFAVPSAAMQEVVAQARPHLSAEVLVAHAVKGFHLPSRRRMSELMLAEVPQIANRLCVIGGPSHAEEVVAQMPTTVVVAGFARGSAERLQDALMNSYFRVYTNPDVVGVELGGALKNIIALAVGVADGLGFGDNAKAALMTRGLAEIARLGMKLGASPLTFAGLAGVGDLIVTCTSRHSRNFRTGRLLGEGWSLEAALQHVGMAVEGVAATEAAVVIARECGVEMPITNVLYNVLHRNKPPRDAVEDLMGRAKSHEIEEVAGVLLSPQWAVVKGDSLTPRRD